jgi:hypothetical protein
VLFLPVVEVLDLVLIDLSLSCNPNWPSNVVYRCCCLWLVYIPPVEVAHFAIGNT